jgi:hypothetical protein
MSGQTDIVYSGIIHMPAHPMADMHGNIRAVIKAKTLWAVKKLLEEDYGVDVRISDMGRFWHESKSAVERKLAEISYGIVYGCPLALSYMAIANYQPFPQSLLLSRQPAENRIRG